MARTRNITGRILQLVLTTLGALLSGLWGALALWYQIPGSALLRGIASAAWIILTVVLCGWAMTRRSWLPIAAYVVAAALLMVWWSRLAPSNERTWADDVAQLVTGEVHGNVVTLHNVRDFTWRSETDYDVRWTTRHYDLERLASADAVLSYWGSPAIAHAMISFGFDDGSRVVFSVEIRKEHDEEYTPIGGFFRKFETTLIAAEERDIIRVRTNARGEDDYLYPLRMDPSAMRKLFLSYVDAGNALAAEPEFYNTLTSNCTTIVYRMARQIEPGLPWDARLLLTGYLPGYLHKVGVLDPAYSVEQWRQRGRITDRARATAPDDDFSTAIRTP